MPSKLVTLRLIGSNQGSNWDSAVLPLLFQLVENFPYSSLNALGFEQIDEPPDNWPIILLSWLKIH